jgi:hypothetical protein
MELLNNKVVTQVVGIAGRACVHIETKRRKEFLRLGWHDGYISNNETVGDIPLADVFPGISQEKIDEIKNSYNECNTTLDKSKQKVIDNIVEKLQDKINGILSMMFMLLMKWTRRPWQKWAALTPA